MKVICTKTGPHCDNHDTGKGTDCPTCPYYTTVQRVEVGTAAEYWQMRYEERQAAFDYLDSLHHKLIIACTEVEEAFDNAIAAFEELAGEHRLLQGCGDEIVEMLNKGQLVRAVIPDSPGPGWYWVRGHWRSRAQNSAAIEPDHPTVQAAPGEGQSGASGEATGLVQIVGTCEIHGPPSVVGEVCYPDAIPAQPCPGCGSYRGTHGLGCRILALTQSGEERSE